MVTDRVEGDVLMTFDDVAFKHVVKQQPPTVVLSHCSPGSTMLSPQTASTVFSENPTVKSNSNRKSAVNRTFIFFSFFHLKKKVKVDISIRHGRRLMFVFASCPPR